MRAAGTVPTVAELRATLRPAVVAAPATPLAVVEEMRAFHEVMRARGFMHMTLKHYIQTLNRLHNFEAWAKVRLLVSTYDIAQHDKLLA